VASLGAVLISVLLNRLTVIKEIENRTWDWRIKLTFSSSKPDKNIHIIEVDQRSLDEQALQGYTWPWPRRRYGRIIKFLELAQAKGLAFDILFTEGSHYGPDDDKQFGEALDSKLPILNIVDLTNSDREIDEDQLELLSHDLFLQNEKTGYSKWFEQYVKPGNSSYDFSSVVMPIPEVLNPAKFYGNASSDPDSDGVMRHFNLGGRFRGIDILSSPFAFYDLVTEGRLKEVSLADKLDSEGRLTLRFKSDGNDFKSHSADAVFESLLQIEKGEEPMIPLSDFKDSWVYLGLTAPGLSDLKPTPISRKGKGVEYLATVLDNIINNDFIKKTSLLFDILIALIFSFLIAGIVFYHSKIPWQISFLLLLFSLFVSAEIYSAAIGYQMSFALPFIAGFLSVIFSFAMQYYLEGRQHRFIRNAFRHYVSPALIEEIVKNPEALSLGGEKRQLTIFFSDIVGFTAISEKLEAYKLVSLMNSFLSEMTALIQSNKGTVDKYIGDAVVAFWNAPLDVEDHAYLAVKTALECQEKLKELNKAYSRDFDVNIYLRVGINTAYVNVGNFGSRERFSYTVLGDGVNLASRLEGVNKIFSTYILITKATREILGDRIKTRKIADIRVVGKTEAVEIFEPVSGGSVSEKIQMEFAAALAEYYNGDLEKALGLFKNISEDPVSTAYILRLESELKKGKDMQWSPIWALTSK
jgi:adenylate cyclase